MEEQPERSNIKTLIARFEIVVEAQLEQHSQNFEIIHIIQTENEILKKKTKDCKRYIFFFG